MTFIWTREPEPEWVKQLAEFSPPTDKVSHLEIVWQPGEVYEPIQRWEIYEMDPNLDRYPEELVADLTGPSPRSRRHKVKDEESPLGWRWWSDSLASQRQWELYGRTGCMPLRFWIVQGEIGGHKWRLTNQERALLRLQGTGLTDVPLPGDLPYAPFDNRVLNQLRTYDSFRRWDAAGPRDNPLVWYPRRQEEERQQFRRALGKWLETQVEQAVDETYAIWRNLDLPEGDRRYNEDEDEIEQAFIEDRPPHTNLEVMH